MRCGLAMAVWATARATTAPPPNIVFVLLDDTGYNEFGYNARASTPNPGPGVKTPRIDALAAGGVRLTNYYATLLCTPTRAAIMTGRYPFRYGVTGYVIEPQAPWGIPLDERFLPEFLQDAGYETAIFGKWHLGFFKPEFLPLSRGFDHQTGLYNWGGDHYSHEIGYNYEIGYDWNVNQVPATQFRGKYSGELVRDDAVNFIHVRNATRHHSSAQPYFLYVAFQESHGPYQVGAKYRAMYPHLATMPNFQNLCGMISHDDAMVGDIVDALDATRAIMNTVVIVSADNGGTGLHLENMPQMPSRFDPQINIRNFPFRGVKHENYEGGVRVGALVYAPYLLPAASSGSAMDSLFHAVDWLPTLTSAAGASLATRRHHPLDGLDQWACLLGDSSKCGRTEVVINFNTVCDAPGGHGAPGVVGNFSTENPAPKAGLRSGDLKLLAECYNASSHSFVGRLELYNLTAECAIRVYGSEPRHARHCMSSLPVRIDLT